MPDEIKACPHCGETILAVAKKCRYCQSYLDAKLAAQSLAASSPLERIAMPVGRPASAIIAGYAGLFSLFPLVGLPAAIVAVWCGTKALREIRETPGLVGRGRAWFGIVLGLPMTIVNIALLVLVIAGLAMEGVNG